MTEGLAYDGLPTAAFLVSKDRYKIIPNDLSRREPNEKKSPPRQGSRVHIETINIGNAADSEAITSLERLEKKTTVWSNFSNIVNVLHSLVGG